MTSRRDRCSVLRRAGAVLAGLSLLATLSACTGDGDDEPSEPAKTTGAANTDSPQTSESTGKAATYDLTNAVRFEGQVFKAVTSRDAVISVDTDGVTTRSLPGAKVSWQLKPAEGFWTDILVEDNGDNGYLLSLVSEDAGGNAVGRDTLVIQQIDMSTGDVLAEAGETIPQDPSHAGQTPTTRILGVVGTIVLVDYAYTRDFNYVHSVIAFELTSGEVKWTAPGTEVLQVSDDLILGNTGTTDEPGPLVGLDPRTGKERWAALDDTTSARLVGRSGNSAVVVRTAPFGVQELTALNANSGETEGPARKIDEVEWTCHKASDTSALCVLPGGKLLGWDVKTNTELWRLPTKDRYAPVITYVSDGKAWGKAKGNAWTMLDAKTGEPIGEGQGPVPIAVNDHGALLNNNGTLEWVSVVEGS